MSNIKITYFNIEGLAEPLRLTLKLAGQKFEDNRIEFQDWPALKPTTPAGTLPLMEVDGEVMTQSGAVLRMWGSQFGMYPSDAMERFRCDELIETCGDIGKSLAPSMYIMMMPERMGHEDRSQEERAAIQMKLRVALVEQLPAVFKNLNNLVAKRSMLTTGKIDIADCVTICLLRRFRSGIMDGIPKDCFDKFADLVKLFDQFHANDVVKTHYA